MKIKILKLSVIIMLFSLLATGCNKDLDPKPELEIWECTNPLETDPEKLILGRWVWSRYFTGWDSIDNKKVEVYKRVERPDWLAFKTNGEMILEPFDTTTHDIQYGTYTIDTLLLTFHLNPQHPWEYEFLHCNDTLRLYITSNIGFSTHKKVYSKLK